MSKPLPMRTEGILTQWNDERGFGFITPKGGGGDIFVHISAFPRDGRRPTIGEPLSFEIGTDNAGRKRASHLVCPNRRTARPVATPAADRSATIPTFLRRVTSAIAIAVLAIYGHAAYLRHVAARDTAPPTTAPPALVADEPSARTSAADFRCDGRTHCSEMTSCTEARFFLQNCPNTAMDGNNDGEPCERQWCTHPFAK